MTLELTKEETLILKSLIEIELGYLKFKTKYITEKDEEISGMLKDIDILTLLMEKFSCVKTVGNYEHNR